MKVNEIRIGNYHYYHIIDPLDERGEYDEVCQIDADDFRVLTEFVCPEYKPIPLTEEWLLRFGFKRVDHIHGYSFYTLAKNKKNPCHLDIYKSKTVWMGYMIDQHCMYVHQLQNLYFALTGEELKIKES